MLFLLTPTLIKSYLKYTQPIDDDLTAFKEWVKNTENQITIKKAKVEKSLVLFRFDPNTASAQQFYQLGFPSYIGDRIINYRNKGGSFSIKADLKKIYGIDTNHVNRLWPYIDLPLTRETKTTTTHQPPQKLSNIAKPSAIKQDINKATADSLQRIRGIGPVLSMRIVKYRESLGGFIHLNQLHEVYGLNEVVISKIEEKYKADSLTIKRLPINTDNVKLLAKHPYIPYNLARVVVAYRHQHGDYTTPHELKNIKIMTDSIFQKISPYLSAQPPAVLQ